MAKGFVDQATPALRRIAEDVREIPREAYDFFVKSTPRRTGNARRRTRLVNGQIQAGYAYAEPLDSGSSRQAPRGMTQPTLDYIRGLVERTTKRNG
jgi:hypothetical protein